MVNGAKKKIASQLIQQISDFPPLPDIVDKIIRTSSDPDSSIDELHRLVEEDLSLSASVIKLANSPFFGLSREVASLPRALTVVGMEEVQNLVIANAMFQTFKGLAGKQGRLRILWKHSFRCALAAKWLAGQCGLSTSDSFIAGQLHDLGKVLVIVAFSRQSLVRIYPEGVKSLHDAEAEKRLLGLTHDQLGGRLVRNWLYPEQLCLAVSCHHQPAEAENHQDFVALVGLADLLAHTVRLPEDSAEAVSCRELLEMKGRQAQKLGLELEVTAESVEGWTTSVRDVCDSFE